ncbi:phosphoesterase, partial [Anaerosalibacter bizertensis]|nr:phosphoesterase [Anaerosalibacter bizertensis]
IGVIVLDDENIKCQIANNKINIIGLNFFIDEKDYNKAIEGIDEKDYNIILSHSPNRPLRYLNGKEDLILSGHTHGGQVRLPIIGAVIAPGQGYFPKYDKGLFELENSILYIDSGLGNSVFPIRFLNRVQISNVLVKSNMK